MTKFLLTKGYLGRPKVVEQAKLLIEKLNLSDNIKIIEEEMSYSHLINLFKIADINLSLLPHDGLGKSIMEAISQKCQLILTSLPYYYIAFGDNVEYVSHENVKEIELAIQRTLDLITEDKKKRIDNNLKWLLDNQDFDRNCKKMIDFFKKVVDEENNICKQ